MQNDCYKCPNRRPAIGSAHSECGLLDEVDILTRISISISPASFTIKEEATGKSLITFNPHGIKNGWCAWPLNFDPTWVKCEIPFEIIEKHL